ncbi:MAG: hypothetical protein GC168_08955 [Candidatus Hydrogenedens sp.]|nr:hypothetical protein [Candidatus Hydrogenedens sp.]
MEQNQYMRLIVSMLSGLLLCGVAPASAETLRESIAAHATGVGAPESPHLDKVVISSAWLDDAEEFVVVYYLDDEDWEVRSVIQIERYEKASDVWSHCTVSEHDADFHYFGSASRGCSGGPVHGIRRTESAYLLSAHINPSCYETLVLSPSLDYLGSFCGWYMGECAGGKFIFLASEFHFAPVHPTQIFVSDLMAGEERLIYPRKPYQSIRLAHIARVQQALDKLSDEQMRKMSLYDNAEYFDEQHRNFVSSASLDACAFVTQFDDELFARWFRDAGMPAESRAHEGEREKLEAIYVYRNVSNPETIEFRELPPEAYPHETREDVAALLEPETLDAIFSVEP